MGELPSLRQFPVLQELRKRGLRSHTADYQIGVEPGAKYTPARRNVQLAESPNLQSHFDGKTGLAIPRGETRVGVEAALCRHLAR